MGRMRVLVEASKTRLLTEAEKSELQQHFVRVAENDARIRQESQKDNKEE
jgi:hypothetical protein